MIILIAGASHTGKTVLAQKLLEKYKYPYLSIDHLKMGLIRSGNTELTPTSDDLDLTAYTGLLYIRINVNINLDNNVMIVQNDGICVPSSYAQMDSTKEIKRQYIRSTTILIYNIN